MPCTLNESNTTTLALSSHGEAQGNTDRVSIISF